MPSDYAAFAYDMMPTVGAFFEGTDMASSILQQKHLSFINSVYEYTVTASSTVSLFLDVNQVVSCYDGTMPAPVPGTMLGNSTSSGLIYPMGANMTYGTNGYIDRTVIFDWSAPQFGFSSWTLPVFVGVGEGGDASAVGETYAFATSLADLPRPGAPAVDWSRVVVGTLTWSDAGAGGQLLDMRVRGSSMGFPAQFGVMGGFFDFAPAAGNTWTFHNGCACATAAWFAPAVWLTQALQAAEVLRLPLPRRARLQRLHAHHGLHHHRLDGGRRRARVRRGPLQLQHGRHARRPDLPLDAQQLHPRQRHLLLHPAQPEHLERRPSRAYLLHIARPPLLGLMTHTRMYIASQA